LEKCLSQRLNFTQKCTGMECEVFRNVFLFSKRFWRRRPLEVGEMWNRIVVGVTPVIMLLRMDIRGSIHGNMIMHKFSHLPHMGVGREGQGGLAAPGI